MVKRLLVLLIFIGILISGCVSKQETKDQTISIDKYETKSDLIGKNIESRMEKQLLSGYSYPITVNYLNSNSSRIMDSGKTQNYAIRTPTHDYINVNFNLSDEKRGYSTIEGAWENSPKFIAINEGNILLQVKRKNYTWRIGCDDNGINISCNGYILIFINTAENPIKNDMTNELINLDIINNLSEFELIVQEGFIRPVITQPKIIKDKEISSERYCEKDEDCVKARGNCCGCTAGGTATAINKDFYAEYEEGLGGCGCVAMMSTDISCFAKPTCLNHECTLDYNDYSVCKKLDYYNDWCYWQFAMSTNNISLCEKISHDEPNVKPSVSACKNEIGKKENEEILSLQTNYTNCNTYLNGWSALKLSQSFRIDAKKLTKAEFIATGTGSEEIILHLREEGINGTEITNMTKSINDALKDRWIEWDFTNVPIEPDKTYFFVFECPKCVHMASIPESPNPAQSHIICFWYAKSDVYSEGNYWLNDESINDWDMAFKLYGIK